MKRETTQLQRVHYIMKWGHWYTLAQIRHMIYEEFRIKDSEAAISARLRDFRKAKFGGHIMNAKRKRFMHNPTKFKNQWVYQLQD